MIKKIGLNVIILAVLFCLPYYFLSVYQVDTLKMQTVQQKLLLVIFLGSAILACLNNFFRKHATDKKWVWIIFEIIGFAGLIYSAGVLWLLYEFRHGIGF